MGPFPLMTLVVWVASAWPRQKLADSVAWVAIMTAALLLGAGYLPTTLAFGWLHWRRGLALNARRRVVGR